MKEMLDLTALNLDRDQTYLVRGLLSGLLDERGFRAGRKRLRRIDGVLEALNEVMGAYGVEPLYGTYWGNEVIACYVNMGNTYTPTVLAPVSGGGYRVGWSYGEPVITSWGDWYENWLLEQAQEGQHYCPNCSTIGKLERGRCRACGFQVFEEVVA